MISVVIPCYHAVEALNGTIETLSAQSYTDWEGICVDDGSRDETGTMLEAWVRREKRLRVIHQQNGGVSSARNRGIAKVCGKQLFFLDSDDGLAPNCLEALANCLEQMEANWCSCNVRLCHSDGSWCYSRPGEDCVLTRSDFLRKRTFVDTTVVWGKLFDRAWWEKCGFRFDERLAVAEDSLLMTQIVCRSERIAHMGSCVGYFYKASDKGSGLMVSAKDKYAKCSVMALGVLLSQITLKSDCFERSFVGELMDNVFHDVWCRFRQRQCLAKAIPASWQGWFVACVHWKRLARWILLLLMQRIGKMHT